MGRSDGAMRDDARREQLRSDGWTSNGDNVWAKDFAMAGKLPVPVVEGIKRITVRDLVNGVMIDDLWMNKSVKPGRV